jgi:hypothetical protein
MKRLSTMKLDKVMLILNVCSVDTQISCIAAKSLAEPLEACQPQEGLKSITPNHPKALGRAIRRAPHREAFIPDIKSWRDLLSW